MYRRLVITGAPEASELNWDEALLYKTVQPFYTRSTARSQARAQADGGTEEDPPQWRFLPRHALSLKTWMTKSFETPARDTANDHTIDRKDALFFTTASFSIASKEGDKSEAELGSETWSSAKSEEALSHFYDHSLGVHKDLPHSVVSISQSTLEDSFVESSAVGNDDDNANVIAVERQPGQIRSLPIHVNPTDLENIPNASYLGSIEPQTVTVDLVVGVVSVPPSRTVKTRNGRSMDIIEIIVGDETKTGFGVTFWLSPTQISHSHPDCENVTRKVLENLRPQDIVQLRNVALKYFRGQVHGQSLRMNRTKIELLYRRKVDGNDEGGVYSSEELSSKEREDVQLMKARRVRDWILNFVSGSGPPRGVENTRGRASSRDGGDMRSYRRFYGFGRERSPLPPDTQ